MIRQDLSDSERALRELRREMQDLMPVLHQQQRTVARFRQESEQIMRAMHEAVRIFQQDLGEVRQDARVVRAELDQALRQRRQAVNQMPGALTSDAARGQQNWQVTMTRLPRLGGCLQMLGAAFLVLVLCAFAGDLLRLLVHTP